MCLKFVSLCRQVSQMILEDWTQVSMWLGDASAKSVIYCNQLHALHKALILCSMYMCRLCSWSTAISEGLSDHACTQLLSPDQALESEQVSVTHCQHIGACKKTLLFHLKQLKKWRRYVAWGTQAWQQYWAALPAFPQSSFVSELDKVCGQPY